MNPSKNRNLLRAALVTGSLFALIAANFLATSSLVAFDLEVVSWIQAHQVTWARNVATWISIVHDTTPTLICVALTGAAAYLSGQRRGAWIMWTAVPGGMFLNYLFKQVFARPRPVFDPLLMTFSFPSGHTVAATLFYGLLMWAALATSRRPAKSAIVCVLAAGMIVLVAWSRVYLSRHFFSDVVAAMFEGATVILLVAYFSNRRIDRETVKPRAGAG